MRVTGSNEEIDIDELMDFVDSVENTFGRVGDFVNVGKREEYEESEDDERRQ